MLKRRREARKLRRVARMLATVGEVRPTQPRRARAIVSRA
jgi:hypothetical protein